MTISESLFIVGEVFALYAILLFFIMAHFWLAWRGERFSRKTSKLIAKMAKSNKKRRVKLARMAKRRLRHETP